MSIVYPFICLYGHTNHCTFPRPFCSVAKYEPEGNDPIDSFWVSPGCTYHVAVLAYGTWSIPFCIHVGLMANIVNCKTVSLACESSCHWRWPALQASWLAYELSEQSARPLQLQSYPQWSALGSPLSQSASPQSYSCSDPLQKTMQNLFERDLPFCRRQWVRVSLKEDRGYSGSLLIQRYTMILKAYLYKSGPGPPCLLALKGSRD